ncbi:MAG TPA: sulfite exporter TauE/SafE family protein [Burkholderiales bacterium]|nr:sulfite exporter TauE/SafE family protein [Burkholderiales bacterium]
MAALSPFELAYCGAVMLLAYGLRGSTGFGGAVGMPLLALVIPIKTLVPVWTLLGFASSVAILGRDRRHVAHRDFIAFIPWCLVGIAIGLYLFKTLDAHTLARGLGVLVLGYAGYSLRATIRPSSQWRWLSRVVAPVASALSGAVGTLFGTMGSVFFAMYLDARALAKDQFRATMSAMLLTLSAVRGIGYFAVGEFTREAMLMFAAAFPLMLAGIYIGDRIHVRLSEMTFRRLMSATLFLCGIPLLLR